jgi:DNA invertase Pin-like site-specific DNA recombinase
MLAFSKLAALAWGISVSRARQIYAIVIRSVLAYGAPNWHKIGENLKDLSKALILTQNKCLRIVSGAYKAIPTRYLESEMAIPPLDLYFDKWVADFESRIIVSRMAQLLRQMGARAAQMIAGSKKRERRGQVRQLLRNSRARATANWVGDNEDTKNTMLRK